MKKRNVLLGLLGVFALVESSATIAGNRPGAFTITPGVAYYDFGSKRNMDNTGMPNLALAYNFNQHWAFEVDGGILNTKNNQNQNVHGALYTVDGVYRFLPHGYFEPYVLAGVGIIGLKPNGTNPTQMGSINAGIGTQFFADKSIALRGEVRDNYTTMGGNNDVLVNFGVSFLFGGTDTQVAK